MRRAEDKAETDALHVEIQALQKILYHIHQVYTTFLTALCLRLCIFLFIHLLINFQLVNSDTESESSETLSSSPLHGQSPLRNPTLKAVQNALSKHQKQSQVYQLYIFQRNSILSIVKYHLTYLMIFLHINHRTYIHVWKQLWSKWTYFEIIYK